MQAEIDGFKTTANDIFTPDLFKWIIIKNKIYEKRRLMNGFAGMANLPAVDNDAINVRNGVKGLGALDEDIIEIADCDFTDLAKLFDVLNK